MSGGPAGDEPVRRSGRLSALRFEQLDDAQREVWAGITSGRRGAASQLIEDGSLVGPFNAMLHSPVIGGRVAALGEALRFQCSLDPVLREVAILTVGAHWRSEFEFWAHSRIAIEVGVDAALVEEIAEGRLSDDRPRSHQVVHAVAQSLLTTGRVDDGTYAETVELLGEAGVVELVTLIGHYCLVSFVLNTFEVPLPGGAPGRWG